ncbi:MAG: hypothetical protein LBG81_07765 [Coriobacteriaceae bacterium]|nr:hypothetical protein [Coriobacteriaceae bacterium]
MTEEKSPTLPQSPHPLEERPTKASSKAAETHEENQPQEGRPLKRWVQTGYAIACFAVCLLPFAGMLWAPTEHTSTTAASAALPGLIDEEGGPNIGYLPQLGLYFEDHFAFRNELIDLNSRIQVSLFATSPTNQVVAGSEGWLYYGGELNDFLARDPLSVRAASNIAHNLSLMQGYAQAMGARFAFAIAPNKSSLYPGHMPYYLPQGENGNIALIKAALEEQGVNYVDLFSLFEAQEEELYCLTDSHWNAEGALLVANALLKACGEDEATLLLRSEALVVGDIEKMLHPAWPVPERVPDISVGGWSFSGGEGSVEDAAIVTHSEEFLAQGSQGSQDAQGSQGAQGSQDATLLMFRDSFANTLIPLLAPQFAQADFSKLVPYGFTQIDALRPDCVIVERAERHVRLLIEQPPIMPAPQANLEILGSRDSQTLLGYRIDGDFLVIEGWIDPAVISPEDDVYVCIEAPDGHITVAVPFYLSGEAFLEGTGGAWQAEGLLATGGEEGFVGEGQAEGATEMPANETEGATNGSAQIGGRGAENSAGSTYGKSDYGFRVFVPLGYFSENRYIISALVSAPDTGKAFTVGSVSFEG